MISRERLSRILKLRQRGEAAAIGDWSRAKVTLAGIRAEADEASARRETLTAEIRSRAQGTVDPRRLQQASEARDAMGRDVTRVESSARHVEAETEDRRLDFESAHRAVRAIRNLIDRSRAMEEAMERAAESRDRDDRGRRELP